MSVSNVSSTTAGLSQFNWRSPVRQARQDFDQLFQAMQAGNMSGAQQAYSDLQQMLSGSAAASSAAATTATTSTTTSGTDTAASAAAASTTSSTATTGNTIASDWSALGQALQSGNAASAQSAFSQLEQDLQSSAQSAQGAEHHRHHHGGGEVRALFSAMRGGAATASTGNGTSTSANSVSADISALQKALQSGDTASAQTLLTQLQNDLQASGQFHGQGHHRHGGFASQNATSAYGSSAVSASAASTGSGSSSTTTA